MYFFEYRIVYIEMDAQWKTVNYIHNILVLANQKHLANNFKTYYKNEIDLMDPDNELFLPLVHLWLQSNVSYKIAKKYANIIIRHSFNISWTLFEFIAFFF